VSWFTTALIFGAYLGAVFFETKDWVAGVGLVLATLIAGATYKRGGKMIEGALVTVIVMVLLLFGSWSVAAILVAFLVVASSISVPILRLENPFSFLFRWKEKNQSVKVTLRR
jgi:hypothetical protein